MKAISLHQPWASAIGAKTIETRGWPTKYRGPIAIHAAKRMIKSELIHLGNMLPFSAVFYEQLETQRLDEFLPFGAIVSTANLVKCVPCHEVCIGEIDTRKYPDGIDLRYEGLKNSYFFTERMMGNFNIGRSAWFLEDIKKLAEPIPWKGSQGFFNVPDELFK